MSEQDLEQPYETPFIGADPIEDEPLEEEQGEDSEEEQEEDSGEEEEEDSEEEEEGSGEEDSGGEEEDSEEEEGAPDGEPIQVPKARLDRQLARTRALENQLKKLTAELEGKPQPDSEGNYPVPKVDIQEAAKGMFDSVLDGDMDKATGALEEIIQAAVNQTASHVMATVGDQVDAKSQEAQFAQVRDALVDTYDFLDAQSEAFDGELVQDINALQDSYMSRGYTPADALQKATEDMVGLRRPEALQVRQAPPPERPPAEKPRQKTTSVKKNLKAATQQPPRLEGTQNTPGEDSDEIDLATLTDEEYDALPEKTKARLRGDVVASA